jgi:hypothetical protein
MIFEKIEDGIGVESTNSFDNLVSFFNSIEVPAQRLGIFRVKITDASNRRYDFHCLKLNMSYNYNLFGFGLNHYGWISTLPKQKYRQSKYHDEEDVSINIDRKDFLRMEKVIGRNEAYIFINKLTVIIVTW